MIRVDYEFLKIQMCLIRHGTRGTKKILKRGKLCLVWGESFWRSLTIQGTNLELTATFDFSHYDDCKDYNWQTQMAYNDPVEKDFDSKIH